MYFLVSEKAEYIRRAVVKAGSAEEAIQRLDTAFSFDLPEGLVIQSNTKLSADLIKENDKDFVIKRCIAMLEDFNEPEIKEVKHRKRKEPQQAERGQPIENVKPKQNRVDWSSIIGK